MIRQGKFITFEGPEGGGKSTHARRLAEAMRPVYGETLVLREPGGTPMGEAVRRLLQHDAEGEGMVAESEIFLFMAGRAQLVRQVIMPALARGANVICDRFADSTTAYQGYGRGCDVERILALNAFATGGLEPDLTILLDLDIRDGFERLRNRNQREAVGPDRIEREDQAFHEKVRAGYLELARRWPQRIRIVDAARDVASVDADVLRIVAAIF